MQMKIHVLVWDSLISQTHPSWNLQILASSEHTTRYERNERYNKNLITIAEMMNAPTKLTRKKVEYAS